MDFGRLLDVFVVIFWYVLRSCRLQLDSYFARFPFPLCVRFLVDFRLILDGFGVVFGAIWG